MLKNTGEAKQRSTSEVEAVALALVGEILCGRPSCCIQEVGRCIRRITHVSGLIVHTGLHTRVCMHTGGRLLLRCDRSPSQEVGSPAAQSVGVADLRVVHKPLNSTRIIRRASIISFSLEVSAFSQGNHPFTFDFFCHFTGF